MGFSTKPGLVPLIVGAQQHPGLPALFGGGGTQCKGPLSQQMASRPAIATPNLRRLCGSHATTGTLRAARKTKQNKTKQHNPQYTHFSALEYLVPGITHFTGPLALELTRLSSIQQLALRCKGDIQAQSQISEILGSGTWLLYRHASSTLLGAYWPLLHPLCCCFQLISPALVVQSTFSWFVGSRVHTCGV